VKKSFTSFLGLAALTALCLAQNANAAPVGSLSCSESNGNDIKFNVSYFTFGITDTVNLGTGTTGGGAGKITLQPLAVHAALSTFAMLEGPAADGAHFSNCTLTTTLSDGATATFVFKPVIITSLTAVGEKTGTNETPAQYTDVQFAYAQLEVKTSGGTDDGGTTPATSTNKITIIGGTGSPN
jgi:hypothetical protein